MRPWHRAVMMLLGRTARKLHRLLLDDDDDGRAPTVERWKNDDQWSSWIMEGVQKIYRENKKRTHMKARTHVREEGPAVQI